MTGLNTDSDPRILESGQYPFALNCDVNTSSEDNKGATETSFGNELISADLPTGVNTCIGTYEDKRNSSIFYFLKNSNGLHSIYRFFPNSKVVDKIIVSGTLNFSEDINHIALRDDLLYWTDGDNPQRKINIVRGNLDSKLRVNLFIEGGYVLNDEYFLEVKDSTGFVISSGSVYIVPTAIPPVLSDVVTGLASGVNSLSGSPTEFIAVNKGTHVELNFQNNGYYEVNFTSSPGAKETIAYYDNMYPQNVIEESINLIKSPPKFAPKLSPVAYTNETNLTNKLFEFRYRYIYKDDESSVLSPNSKVSEILTAGNAIEVDINDIRILDYKFLSELKAIELIVRDSNISVWKVAKRFTPQEFFFILGKHTFTNNEELSAISEEEASKLSEAIPLTSNVLEVMDNRLVVDEKENGYDTVDVDVDLELVINTELPTTATFPRSVLKRPGNYKWGIVYFDNYNRSNTVSKNAKMDLYVPGFSEDLDGFSYINDTGKKRGIAELNWKIKHQPPIWAKHYAWVRTEETIHNEFLQSRINSVEYLKDDLTATTYGSPDATIIKLKFDHWNDFNNSNSEADYGWSYVKGDKIRLLKNEANAWENTIYESELVSQEDGITISVKNDPAFPEQKQFSLVELFTPGKEVENSLYHEIGEFFDIGNAGESDRFHEGNVSSQDPNDYSGTPAEGVFKEGDVYKLVSSDYQGAAALLVESKTTNQKVFDMRSFSKGRANIFTTEPGKSFDSNKLRYSNVSLSGTGINGFSNFDFLNSYELPIEYGKIKSLKRVSNILLCVMAREAVSLYINENIYTDLTGQDTVAISDKFIGDDRILRGAFGTDNPESVIVQDSNAYWFCANKGKFVRYGGDGLTPISEYFMSRFFQNKGRLLMANSGKVFTSFDKFNGKLVIAFTKILDDGLNELSDSETLTFDEAKNVWTSFWSYKPERMGKVDSYLVSFESGDLYLHSTNSVNNNFYGTQYKSQIKFVFNDEPDIQKVSESISIESSELWVPIEITTPEGQKTSLTAPDFEKLENFYYSNILKDENTPDVSNPITRGEDVRSNIFFVLLESDSTTKSILRSVKYLSNKSNTGFYG